MKVDLKEKGGREGRESQSFALEGSVDYTRDCSWQGELPFCTPVPCLWRRHANAHSRWTEKDEKTKEITLQNWFPKKKNILPD